MANSGRAEPSRAQPYRAQPYRAQPYRAAIYWAPAADDPLWAAGCRWLGRDAESGAVSDAAGGAATASPRRYGFHATLKPPMRLAGSLEALVADVRALVSGRAPFVLPALQVARLGRFLALVLQAPCPALQALADDCVTGLDGHRVPEDAAAQARRAAGLGAREQDYVAQFGYPHVLQAWRFHMTLSDSGAPAEMLPAAQAYFAGMLAPRVIDSVGVFVEGEKGEAFRLVERVAFSN